MDRKTTILNIKNSGLLKVNLLKLVLVVTMILSSGLVSAQSTANYSLTTAATGTLAADVNGNTIDFSTGATTLVAASADDTQAALTNIGFDFWLMGTYYNQFSASDNGVVSLGAQPTTTNYVLPNSNDVTIATLAPFANDLRVGTNGVVRSKVFGTAPNRCLVVEWNNVMIRYLATAATGTGTFQARIYETTGAVEYVYGAMSANAASATVYNVGFSVNSTANRVVSVNTTAHTASTSATVTNNNYTASSTITSLNSTSNGSRRFYRFGQIAPTAPSGLSFSNVGAANMTLNWTDSASNEVGYVIYFSTDNVTFTFLGQLPAGSTGANITGLNPGTLYYYKVYAVREGALSTSLNGSQATKGGLVYASSGTATIPCYLTSVTAEAWGGGGKGGQRSAGNNIVFAGGGGGAYSSSVLTGPFSGSYTITVGAGSTTTAAGGDSWVGSAGTLLAKGGSSVANNSNTPASGGLASACVGTIKYNGGNGAAGVYTSGSNYFGGGGGASAASSGAGNFTNLTTVQNAGAAASFDSGNGGDGANPSSVGINGGFPGGGGGGGARIGGVNRAYGDGADGQVIISWNCPSATIAYSGSPYCKTLTSGTVTITGTDARTTCTNTFSSTPAGLSIDATTGAINPSASTAGTYTVSYQLAAAGGCSAVNATATVVIYPAFTSGTIASTGEAICLGVNPSVTIGNTVAASGGDGVITYSWRSSADGYTTAISGATTTTYLPPAGLTTTTSYRRYAKDNTCNTTPTVTSGTWTVTVNAVPASGTLTPTPAPGILCAGTSVSATATAGSGGAGTIVDELQVSLSGGAYTAYISGTTINTSSQTSVSIRTRRTATGSGCTASGYNTVAWTFNPRPTASVLSGSSAICAGTTTNLQVAITGGTSPYSVVYSAGSVGSYVSGANIPVTPASTTAYTLASVTDSNGCVGVGNSGTANVTIDLTTSTNGGPWSNGTPVAGKSVVFDGTSVTLGADFTACSLRLKNNSVVTIPSGTDVILTGALAVETGSTFTLNNNANLLQSIPAGVSYTNTGNANVKRNSSAIKRLDYTLWSSPVTGQKLYSFSPFTFGNRFYVYRTNTNLYNNPDVGFSLTGLDANGVNGTDSNNVQFAQAKGYLVRTPWDHPTAASVWNGTFTGVPNNGNINYTMANLGSGQRFNLVGNPYPSPMSMTQFVTDNTNVPGGNNNITGTLYFWRETNNNTSNNAYCSWAGGTFTTNSEAQVFNPNGIIRTGQGFFVEAVNASTTLVFNNGQRSGDNSDQFFRPSPNAVNDVEANRFWLNLTNASGAFSQMAAGYMTNATNGVDLYDGKNINTGNVLLNSILDNTDYTIQGKSLPFATSDVIPLSYKVTEAGSYTIAIDHVDGLFEGGTQAIYLRDNLTATEHNLQTGAYNFASEAGSFTNRFEIIYESQLSNPVFTPNTVVVYSQNNDFVVNSGNTIMSSIKVFDIRGRLLQEKTRINANQTLISGGLVNQVLLLQITSEDGKVVTKKVIR